MKKFLVILLALAAALCISLGVAACAPRTPGGTGGGGGGHEGEEGEDSGTDDPLEGLEFRLNEGGESYAVTGIGTYTGSDLVIPSEYQGFPVATVGRWAFKNRSSLTSVTIPASVTTVEDSAFANCSSLTSLTLSEGLTSIEFGAFERCYLLKNITIPASVTEIGHNAFWGCDYLESVTFEGESGLTSVGDAAFDRCFLLNAVHISDLASWCKINFRSYNANPLYLAQHLYLDKEEGGASEELTELNIPDGVTKIGDYAFVYGLSITSVTIPDSVTAIGFHAFRWCTSLESITIPFVGGGEDEHEIGRNDINKFLYLFGDDQGNLDSPVSLSLTKVVVTGGTSIGFQAFKGCETIQSITLPATVTEIENDAFTGCKSLNAVTISDVGAWCAIDFGNADSNPLSIAHHLYMDGKEVKELHIPDGVTGIQEYAFYNGTFTSVIIPESVTSIGSYAFASCGLLTSIIIPESVTSIGVGAFTGCDSLQSVMFEQAEGWKVSQNSNSDSAFPVTVSDPQTAAEYLRDIYSSLYWRRT